MHVRVCVCVCVCVCACMCECVCVCVSYVCVAVLQVGLEGVRLILSCISTGAGLGHINILINMRESITEEARA